MFFRVAAAFLANVVVGRRMFLTYLCKIIPIQPAQSRICASGRPVIERSNIGRYISFLNFRFLNGDGCVSEHSEPSRGSGGVELCLWTPHRHTLHPAVHEFQVHARSSHRQEDLWYERDRISTCFLSFKRRWPTLSFFSAERKLLGIWI